MSFFAKLGGSDSESDSSSDEELQRLSDDSDSDSDVDVKPTKTKAKAGAKTGASMFLRSDGEDSDDSDEDSDEDDMSDDDSDAGRAVRLADDQVSHEIGNLSIRMGWKRMADCRRISPTSSCAAPHLPTRTLMRRTRRSCCRQRTSGLWRWTRPSRRSRTRRGSTTGSSRRPVRLRLLPQPFPSPPFGSLPARRASCRFRGRADDLPHPHLGGATEQSLISRV